MRTFVFASSNLGKIQEITEFLADKPFTIYPQSKFQIEEIEETGLSFVENAILKARHACRLSGLPALGDDSGLEVDALQGAPGIYSARYAREQQSTTPATANINKLLEVMKDIPIGQRQARFQCVLVYLSHAEDATPLIWQGTWEGEILPYPQGEYGFGYDPIFYVPTHDCSAAELSKVEKNRLSHRGQALRHFCDYFGIKNNS